MCVCLCAFVCVCVCVCSCVKMGLIRQSRRKEYGVELKSVSNQCEGAELDRTRKDIMHWQLHMGQQGNEL